MDGAAAGIEEEDDEDQRGQPVALGMAAQQCFHADGGGGGEEQHAEDGHADVERGDRLAEHDEGDEGEPYRRERARG